MKKIPYFKPCAVSLDPFILTPETWHLPVLRSPTGEGGTPETNGYPRSSSIQYRESSYRRPTNLTLS